MKKILIVLILLVGCGKNADPTNADNFIIDHERPTPINQRINLMESPRDITIFAFPDQSEVSKFYFDRNHPSWDEETMADLLSMVNYGEKYLFEITKDMSPSEKVQSIVGKVMAISDARDNTIRGSYTPKKISKAIVTRFKDKLNDEFPCYEVKDRRHPNYKKCYLKEIAGFTKPDPKKWRFETCMDMIKAVTSYLEVTPDVQLVESDYLLTEDRLDNWKVDSETCAENQKIIDRNFGLYGNGTRLVAELIGSAEVGSKNKLLFKAKSDLFALQGAEDLESFITFNPETLRFEKFSIAVDFFDGGGPAIYSPEAGNMTQPTVTEIGGSGFYRVDFEFKTPNFTLKTLGLSLAVDPVFGLRVSGKTLLYYPDGRTRAGIMRFDVSTKE